MSGSLGVILLAAGAGTRMKSALPKVLHPVCGTAMVHHAYRAALGLSPTRVVVVVGHEGGQVRTAFAGMNVEFVEQSELLGTGDAVRRCASALGGCDEVLVLNGDSPLLTSEVLHTLSDARGNAPAAFLTYLTAEPGRMGRVVRDALGGATQIVEAADYAGPEGPAEVNAGKYLFDAAWLWRNIVDLPVSTNGEYYLTHLIAAAAALGNPTVPVTADLSEVPDLHRRHRSLTRAWQSLVRLPFVLGRLLLELLPVVVFAGTSTLILGTEIGDAGVTRLERLLERNAVVAKVLHGDPAAVVLVIFSDQRRDVTFVERVARGV